MDARRARIKSLAIIPLLLIVVISSSGCTTDVTEQDAPNHNALSIESSFQSTDSHQINQSFSVFNSESKALTNVVVEVYLLAPDQNISQEFTYLDHKQISLGTINSGEKTNEYYVVVGEENPESDYSAYLYVKASSAEGGEGSSMSDVFSVSSYSSTEYFENAYCPKIDPYNIEVRKAASEAVKAHPGEYSIDQLLDIYDWVKSNINYLNVPVTLPSTPYSPPETLATKSGDCKNQAVLIASMIESIGGSAKVVLQPSCEHAYTIVYFTDSSSDIQDYVDTILDHYLPCRTGFVCGGECWNYPSDTGAWCDDNGATTSSRCPAGSVGFGITCHSCSSGQTLIIKDGSATCRDNSGLVVNWFDYEDGKWIIFDPAGGFYPGDTIPDCLSENSERYFVDSCVRPPT